MYHEYILLYCTEEFLPVAGRYIYLKTLSSLNQGCNTGCFKNIKISSAYARSKQIPIGIWEISQMPGYLGNFPNAYCYLRVVYFLDFQMNGNFQDTQAFGEFPKYPDIWGIPQKPKHLGFPKCLGFWETLQISSHLRNFQYLKNIPPSNTFGEFPKCLGIWENFPNAYFDKKCKCCRGMVFDENKIFNLNLD